MELDARDRLEVVAGTEVREAEHLAIGGDLVYVATSDGVSALDPESLEVVRQERFTPRQASSSLGDGDPSAMLVGATWRTWR